MPAPIALGEEPFTTSGGCFHKASSSRREPIGVACERERRVDVFV